MVSCFLAVSAVMPSILIVWYFHKRDVYPEPPRVLWTTFGLGVLTVFPVIIIELLIQVAVDQAPGPIMRGALDAFVCAAFTEEAFKLLVLLTYVWRHREFNEPMDGIIYGVVASLGFATFENVLYVFQGGIGLAIMRALTAVPSHATEGAILGYFVGRARFARSGRGLTVLTGFAAAVLLHGLYDFPLLSLSAGDEIAKAAGTKADSSIALLVPLTFITLAVAIVWAISLTRKLRREQLAGQIFAPPVASAEQGLWTAGPQGRSYITDPRQAHQTYWPQPQAAPQPKAQPDAAFPTPAPAPMYAAAPVPVAGPPGSRLVAVASLVTGFLLGSIGGMVVLAIIVAFAIGSVKPDEVGVTILGTLIIGVLPLAAGGALFTMGIVKLNRK